MRIAPFYVKTPVDFCENKRRFAKYVLISVLHCKKTSCIIFTTRGRGVFRASPKNALHPPVEERQQEVIEYEDP